MDHGAHRSALGEPAGPGVRPGGLGGLGPAGFDAACLYLHSLLVPEMAERVHAELAAELDSRDGLLSQLYVVGRMLLRVNAGDYPDLAVPLHHHADGVIAELSRR